MFRQRGREKERDRNINVWLSLTHPLLGTWPATQACALTGNRTSDLSVRRLVLNPLSYTSQGIMCVVLTTSWSHKNGLQAWNTDLLKKKEFSQPVLDLPPCVGLSYPVSDFKICLFFQLQLTFTVILVSGVHSVQTFV